MYSYVVASYLSQINPENCELSQFYLRELKAFDKKFEKIKRS